MPQGSEAIPSGAQARFRVSEAARFLGVSDDSVRRWADAGRLELTTDAAGRFVVEGAELARLAKEIVPADPSLPLPAESARNHFPGLVTDVRKDGVMAQVEIQAGPHRVVSLMSREAADELGLEPGVAAVASVKATNVVVDLPVWHPRAIKGNPDSRSTNDT